MCWWYWFFSRLCGFATPWTLGVLSIASSNSMCRPPGTAFLKYSSWDHVGVGVSSSEKADFGKIPKYSISKKIKARNDKNQFLQKRDSAENGKYASLR